MAPVCRRTRLRLLATATAKADCGLNDETGVGRLLDELDAFKSDEYSESAAAPEYTKNGTPRLRSSRASSMHRPSLRTESRMATCGVSDRRKSIASEQAENGPATTKPDR
jgi:hypothetical protein